MSHWTKDDVIELLVGIIAGGRGGGGLVPGPDLATQMITGSGQHPTTSKVRTKGRLRNLPRSNSKKKRKVFL